MNILINDRLCKYMEGEYFEFFIAEIYSFLGFKVEHTRITGDQGLDLVIYKDNSFEKIGIQCKRFKNNVGNYAVQEAFAGMYFYKCDKASVITPSRFTKSAKELGNKLGIELIDQKKLNDILRNIQDILLEEFYRSYKFTEILINSSIELITETDSEQDIVLAVELLEHIYNSKEKIDNKLIGLLYNNLAIGLKRLNKYEEAIKIYEEGLATLSFPNEDSKYLIIGNLIVTYIYLKEFSRAKEIVKMVSPNNLTGLNKQHFENMVGEIEQVIRGRVDVNKHRYIVQTKIKE